ncbi:hypothetical protein MBGDN05_00177 [Thermoplasmatales archaeon SCGC AB-539-N05]|nr:hypothetical protein MBGDN05_00177 [Thermoplasmatales archaeon SCGC AB-539-N05]
MSLEKYFLEHKKNALQKLEKAIDEKEVDTDILSILNLINASDEYYTSSSCTGRIVLLEIPNIGDKKGAKFLGKWHRIIESDEVLSATKNAKTGLLWLLAQSPIIHMAARTNAAADKILKIAISSGFKNSGLKSIGKRIIVEICSTERIDAPIGKNGELLCSLEHLKLLINISNEIIRKSNIKLGRFERMLLDSGYHHE